MKLRNAGLYAAIAGVVLGLPVLGSHILTFLAERDWEAVEAEAKAAGVPLTPAEALKDYQPGPDDRNAAEGVKGLLRMMSESHGEFLATQEYGGGTDKLQARMNKFYTSDDPPDWKSLRRLVGPFEESLQRLAEAVKLPDWNFKRDWNRSLAGFADARAFQSLSHMLWARAVLAMHDGDFEKALESVRAQIQLGRHLQSEPSLAIVEPGVEVHLRGLRSALDIRRVRPLSPSQTKRMSEVVAMEPNPVDWQRAWRAGHATYVDSMKHFLTEEGLSELGMKPGDGFTVSRRRYLVAKTKAVRLLVEADREWQNQGGNAGMAASISTRFESDLDDLYNLSGFYYHYGRVDTYARGAESYRALEARRRLTHLALQIASQEAGTWRLPADALQKAWLDPFNSKPMLLDANSKGFRLYSVGTNGVDDGGNGNDVVVTFPYR